MRVAQAGESESENRFFLFLYQVFTWSKSSLPGGRESSGPLTSGHWVATKEGEIRIMVRDEDSEATVTASWSGVDGGKSL